MSHALEARGSEHELKMNPAVILAKLQKLLFVMTKTVQVCQILMLI